jgi:hypothetical protein
MARRKSIIDEIGGFFLLGGIVMAIVFIQEHFLVFIIASSFIALLIFFSVRNKKKNGSFIPSNNEMVETASKTNKSNSIFEGKTLVLPKIEASAEIQQKVQKLIAFVYEGGDPPPEKILSKENQHNILCQIFAMDIDVEKYKPFIQEIYQNATNKGYTYSKLAYGDEWYPALHFAFESITRNIIELTVKSKPARESLHNIDNLAKRLLEMDRDVFKNLFLRLHEYHFWYVYTCDNDYSRILSNIKNRLGLCHGIKQTEFYKRMSEQKDELSYTLYFGEKAGEIIRKQDGRTYRLYLPEDNPDEIPPYEYTQIAVYDGHFDYKKYWKDIEAVLKKNEGILQTEFYTLFDWSSEILTRALREAANDGKVIRQKKGNTYILHSIKTAE